MPSPKRVLVVVNKWWECDPVMGALLHDKARPQGAAAPAGALPWPAVLHHPRRRPAYPAAPGAPSSAPAVPRAVFALPNVWVEVWCISDLLEHLPDGEWQSSSEQKALRLPEIAAAGPAPALVVAVGTAGTPTEETYNGSVVVGTNVFMHNGKPGGTPATTNPLSNWTEGPFDQLVTSALSDAAFARITDVAAPVAARLAVPPGNPAADRTLIAAHDLVALGNVNVSNYADYDVTDQATVDAFRAAGVAAPAGTLETTHGLIRVKIPAPFLFVSGVTDRVKHFPDEVSKHEYAQNFVAAHNAGIAVAWMLPQIDAAVGAGLV